MPDYSPHQRKIIQRYYDNRDTIALSKLQELVTELCLAESQKKQDSLWKRVEKALKTTALPPDTVTRILAERSPDNLARIIRDQLSK